MAMLAKQGWRLLVDANPLVSAIIKARYYSNTNVMMAELGNNPSYVWRGIYQALAIVKSGARRKIGNVETTTVSSLMNVGGKSWDIDLLNDLFCPRDVALIQRIPIPMIDSQDSWYWLPEEKGLAHLLQCFESDKACDVFSRVLDQSSKKQGIQVALLCWNLWNRRNKWVWDRANGSVFGVISAANHLIRDWREAQVKDEKRTIRGAMGARVWSKPNEGWLKVNIDAAIFLYGSIGVSAIVRDDQARFVASRGNELQVLGSLGKQKR
ncbi:uncharacterized protein LOC141714927 [Apium graveolens]|uniref:uncharacterized protein LOC141714927 n=1 Tax=Apium graveolens TaxID=4045 RepID=UPI003D79718A